MVEVIFTDLEFRTDYQFSLLMTNDKIIKMRFCLQKSSAKQTYKYYFAPVVCAKQILLFCLRALANNSSTQERARKVHSFLGAKFFCCLHGWILTNQYWFYGSSIAYMYNTDRKEEGFLPDSSPVRKQGGFQASYCLFPVQAILARAFNRA